VQTLELLCSPNCFQVFLIGAFAGGGAWDLEATVPLEDAANAAQDQVCIRIPHSAIFFQSTHWNDQAKRKEKMVKGMLQKQMMSVADQTQRLNKVRVELEKLEMVWHTSHILITVFVFSSLTRMPSAHPSGCGRNSQ
jgi:hypothetical protein